MTTFDTAAAWQKTKPIAFALFAGWMAFGLAGCETANSLTSSLFSSGGDAPTASVSSPPPMATSKGAQFAVAPVIGPPENVSGELRTQLIADMERQGIRVAKTPDEKADYTLRGYVVSSLEKKGTKSKVSYIWDVTDASGKGVHRVSGEESANSGKSKDPWTAVTPALVQTIAAKTVTSVTSWMPRPGGATPAVASAGTSGGSGTDGGHDAERVLRRNDAVGVDRHRQHRLGEGLRADRHRRTRRRQLDPSRSAPA